ncbi:urea ABC transporter permease subunit UrtB, partial [Oceanospirillum sp. HFRX-1_2]
MKRFLSLCALLSIWLSFALAQPALANSTQVQPLLAELTEKSLTKAIPVLEQLEATGSDRVLPVFQAMLAG